MFKLLNISVFVLPFIVLIVTIFIKRKKKIVMNPDRIAKLWERSVAFIIDIIIVIALSLCVQKVLEKFAYILTGNYIEELTIFIISWCYFSGFESSKSQATLGKIFEGIKVTDIDGKRISFLHATFRFLFSIISEMSLFIGYLIIPFTKQKQGLHDMLANTLVLKSKKRKKGSKK